MNIFKKVLLEIFSIYVLSNILNSFIFFKSIETYFLSGIVLWLLSVILKPILKFVTAPFYLLTFGATSVLINGLIFFILTKLVSGIEIKNLILKGFYFYGFIVPKLNFNLWETFIIVATCELMIKWIFLWITKE